VAKGRGIVTAIAARLRRVREFMASGASPAQWAPLGALGWSRGNPSGVVPRRIGLVTVKPALLRGRAVTIDPTDLGQLVSFDEICVQGAYELQRVPFTPAVIVDCGAHIGLFSALAAATFPSARLLAFEPNPANLEHLRRNLAQDGGRAEIHAAAVSTADGRARFSADVSNGGRLTEGGSREVAVVDLRAHLPRAESLLLKLDIEGEETRVLPHVLPALPKRCAMFVETHDGAAAVSAVTSLLAGEGFVTTVLRERGRFADLFACRDAA
jgi:FkbM family methyltransferase